MSHLAGQFPWTTVDPLQSLAILPAAMATESKLVRASPQRERGCGGSTNGFQRWTTPKRSIGRRSRQELSRGRCSTESIARGYSSLPDTGFRRRTRPRSRVHQHGTWAARFPSVFQIAGEEDLTRAGQLILLSADTALDEPRNRFTRRSDQLSAGEVEGGTAYQEGAVRQVTVNAYERNQEAREAVFTALRAELHHLRVQLHGSVRGRSRRLHSGPPHQADSTRGWLLRFRSDQGLAPGLSELPCGDSPQRSTL